jgi:hypothetical protein
LVIEGREALELQDGTITIGVRLLFRRAYKDLMDQKGWNVPDIVMPQQSKEPSRGLIKTGALK